MIQYAATGLPVVSLDPAGTSDALPEMVVAHDRDELAARLEQLLADPDRLRELGLRTRARFERRLSAERRAELLEALLRDPDGWRAMSIAERATLWRRDDTEPDDAAPGRRPTGADGRAGNSRDRRLGLLRGRERGRRADPARDRRAPVARP